MKDVRKLYQSVLALSLLTAPISSVAFADTPSSSTAVSPQSAVTVTIDGKVQTFDQPPVLYHDFTLVPLRGIFETLGAKVGWDQTTQKVTADKGDIHIELQVAKNLVYKNGLPIQMSVPAQIINGRTMVPLRFISEALGAKVDWVNDTHTVVITTNTVQTVAPSFNGTSVSQMEGNLSLKQAVELAIANSTDLKSRQIGLDQSKLSADQTRDNIDYVPISNGSGPNVDAINKAFGSSARADISVQVQQKQYDMAVESVDYKVQKAYDDVLQKQKDVELAGLSLKDEQWKKQITDVKAQNGLASVYDQQKENSTLQETQGKLDLAQKALIASVLSFNQVLGVDANKRYTLTDQPTYQALTDDDVEHQVTKVATSSNAAWLADQNITLAQLDLNLYTFNAGNTPYDAVKEGVDKAKITAAQSKQQLEDSVRTIYNSIKQNETQYDQLQATLAKSQQDLDVLQKKYDLGMATAQELYDGKLAVEQTKQKIFDIVLALDTLKVAYEKPWVASGGSTGSSSSN
jgi:hypothetical protein